MEKIVYEYYETMIRNMNKLVETLKEQKKEIASLKEELKEIKQDVHWLRNNEFIKF